MSLTLYRMSDSTVLAHLNHFKKNCISLSDYSSCALDSASTRNSLLRILVSDLEEEEERMYGCNATILKSLGKTSIASWSVLVKRESK